MSREPAKSNNGDASGEMGKSPLFAIPFLLMGGFIMAMAAGILPIEPDPSDAPPFVIGIAGFAFFAAGGAMMVEGNSAARSFWAMLIVASMAGISLWIAFFGDEDKISGGIPFLPQSINAMLGKILFGFGALVTAFMVILAFRDGLRRLKKGQEGEGT